MRSLLGCMKTNAAGRDACGTQERPGLWFSQCRWPRGPRRKKPRRRRFPTPPPARNRSPAIATCYSAKLDTGAYVTAAMPKTWNGNLIVFAHGGPSLLPPTPNGSKSDLNKYAYAVQRGFGWVASSYRRAGYGVAMAAADSDDARKAVHRPLRQAAAHHPAWRLLWWPRRRQADRDVCKKSGRQRQL